MIAQPYDEKPLISAMPLPDHHDSSSKARLDRRSLLKVGITGLLLTERCVLGRAAEDHQLITHTRVPHNAEPPLGALIESWVTPNDLFYIRSHAPVPDVDVDTFRLSVEGMVHEPYEVSLSELQSTFAKRECVATLTCAGNRRNEHSEVRQVDGVPWQAGAIGNARWGGTRLSDLLNKAGIQEGAKYVWFEGTDQIKRDSGSIPFGASIPVEKALGDTESMPGALVAYEMNNAPLPPDHGFPMRTVVPGYIGARSVKWLGKIIVSDRPSPNHYVSHAYKLVTENEPQQWADASPLGDYVMNSVICKPRRDAHVEPGELTVQGYALPPGEPGKSLSRVEVSTDGGRSWTTARITTPARPYCWSLWQAKVSVNASTTALTVRAVDSSGKMQPRTVPWNLKGYMYNAWYELPIDVS